MAVIVGVEVLEILGLTGEILGIVQALQSILNGLATRQDLEAIRTQLNTIQGVTQTDALNTEQSFTNVEDDINALAGAIAQARLAIGNLPQSGQPVTLPRTPPPGYGGATGSEIGDAVWLYPLPNATPFTALEAQDSMMAHFYFLGNNQYGYSLNSQPGYAIVGIDTEQRTSFSGPSQPFLDFSTILPTDASIFAWAQRVYPGTTWHQGIDDTVYEVDSNNAGITWWVDLTQLQFRQWKATGAAAAARVAPVWPGLANVTLGASVPLADQQVLAGPMDGVIVHLTSVPASKTSYFFATTEHDWFRIGAITFRDDHGDEEPPQLLGFDHAVYCARTMQHASSCLVRLQGAVTGTIQPWHIT